MFYEGLMGLTPEQKEKVVALKVGCFVVVALLSRQC
jgi:hypothetical protein